MRYWLWNLSFLSLIYSLSFYSPFCLLDCRFVLAMELADPLRKILWWNGWEQNSNCMESAGRRVLPCFFRLFSKKFMKYPSIVTFQLVFLSKISAARTFLWHLDFIIILRKRNSLLSSCRTTAKEKKPSRSSPINTPIGNGGFEKIEAAVSLCSLQTNDDL